MSDVRDELGKALDDANRGFELWMPERGHLPKIWQAGPARLAMRILYSADYGNDAERLQLDTLIDAYQEVTWGEIWPDADTREEKIAAIREDLAGWRRLHATDEVDPYQSYLMWDGMARADEGEVTRSQAARRMALYVMHKRGLSLRDLAEIVGRGSHAAVQKAINHARADLDSKRPGTGWASELYDRLVSAAGNRDDPQSAGQVVAVVSTNDSKAAAAEAWQRAVADHGFGPVEIIGKGIDDDPIAQAPDGTRYVLVNLSGGRGVYAMELYRPGTFASATGPRGVPAGADGENAR